MLYKNKGSEFSIFHTKIVINVDQEKLLQFHKADSRKSISSEIKNYYT